MLGSPFHTKLVRQLSLTLFLSCGWITTIAPHAFGTEFVVLKSSESPYYVQAVQGFRKELPPDIRIIEYTLPESAIEARELGQSIRAAHPDLLLTVGLKASLTAKAEIPDIPVIFCLVLNPELHGLPAPNMTGISVKIELSTQLNQIKLLVPKARRIGLLYAEQQEAATIPKAKRHAKSLGLQLIAVPVKDRDQVFEALHTLLPQIDLFWLLPDHIVVTEESIPILVNASLEANVPLFGFSSTLVQRGALGALVIAPEDAGKQAGRTALVMLRTPSSIKHQLLQPEHPKLALNVNTAEYFGLAFSPDTIRMATRVFGGPGAFASEHDQGDQTP